MSMLLRSTHTLRSSTNFLRLSKLNRPVIRMMAQATATATPAAKHEWLVIVPDFEGAIEKRIAARGKHLENIRADGPKWLVGGAYLSTPHTDPSTTPAMKGSAMIVLADSEEEVRQRLREDVYAKEGAWDVEKATVWPFKSAVRVGI